LSGVISCRVSLIEEFAPRTVGLRLAIAHRCSPPLVRGNFAAEPGTSAAEVGKLHGRRVDILVDQFLPACTTESVVAVKVFLADDNIRHRHACSLFLPGRNTPQRLLKVETTKCRVSPRRYLTKLTDGF